MEKDNAGLVWYSARGCGVGFGGVNTYSGPLWPGVVVPVSVSFMGQIDLFKDYLYLIGQCANTNLLRNDNTKAVNLNIKWIWFSNILALNIPHELACH